MISIDRLKEMVLEDIEENPEKHLEESTELLQQLDQLKAELEQEKAWHKTSDEISKANSEYTAKLKQTLTEIKEIAEKYKNLNFGEQQYCYSEVLRKISEVEDET